MASQNADLNSEACEALDLVYTICEGIDTDFARYTTFASRASCLCYSSTYWVPEIYDAVASSCIDWYSTADPVELSIATRSNGGPLTTDPCFRAGNVLDLPRTGDIGTTSGPLVTSSASGTSSSSSDDDVNVTGRQTTFSPPLITSPPLPTNDPNARACSSIVDKLSACESSTPGFTAISDFSEQASCLCYAGHSAWAPNLFDGAWGSCFEYYRTESPGFYGSISDMGTTPCESAGLGGATSSEEGPISEPTNLVGAAAAVEVCG